MRRPLAALLLLGLLTACSARPAGSPALEASDSPSPTLEVSPASTPAEAWWADLTVEDLPDDITDPADVEAGSGAVYLLAELPEADIALYGYGSDDLTGVLLRRGEHLSHWEEPYLSEENPAAPTLWWDDFDGDGANELAVQYLTENTLQRRQVGFRLYSPAGTGWDQLALDLSGQCESLLAGMTCSLDPESSMVEVTFGALSTSAWLEDLPVLPTGEYLTAGESVYFRRDGGDIFAVLPLGINFPGQSAPRIFAQAVCSVMAQADGLALEPVALETLYSV